MQERLEREFGINLITTAPSVRYRINKTNSGAMIEVDNPTKFPEPNEIDKIEEPIIRAMIITSEESVGGVLQLCEDKRGVQKNFEYLSPTRVMVTYDLPLNEIVLDFYDRLEKRFARIRFARLSTRRISGIGSGEIPRRAGRRRRRWTH